CDGCQLSLLDCEDELLAVAGAVRIAHFLEASRAVVAGPYDVSLVEGSVSTPSDVDRIHRIRAESKLLVAIGACATAGGIQALRNFADVDEFRSIVYARPEYLSTLDNVHADLRARDRGPGVARLPHRPATAARHPGRGADRAPAGPAAAQRVFRVQSARYAVRPGRAGDTLPGPGHRGRLRRAVPGVRARLLRLLRPGRDPEHARPDRPAARARHGRDGDPAGVRDLQRGGVPGDVMTHRPDRSLHVAAIARVEGEGAMRVRVERVVTDVALNIYEPPRFFEAMLRGRRYTEPPDITARICGICPVAYQMSACQAIEEAC